VHEAYAATPPAADGVAKTTAYALPIEGATGWGSATERVGTETRLRTTNPKEALHLQ
jgi:hypothetical protein